MKETGDIRNQSIVPPDPALVLESLRSIGYSLETAVADIIDNSISAGARHIHFDTVSDGEYIMISDDGRGMSESELINALKLGSADPLEDRNVSDLGRFGLGLKLASLSHCRKLTVASKSADSPVSIRQWDLDVIRKSGEWVLLEPDISDYPRIKEKLGGLEHGTVVYWEHIDRFVKDNKNVISSREEKNWYAKQIRTVVLHLSMVFHRFLEEGDLSIILPDGSSVEPWDPFLSDHVARKPLASETAVPGIAVYPYILPHKSKFRNTTEYEAAAGPMKTWVRAQGFYVYRGKRLITAGSWLGLKGFTKSHETDLARIRLDISNDEDAEWMLDVKKSAVKIPRKYRDYLEKIARLTRDEARKVRLYRGKVSRREHPGDYKFLWTMDKNRNGEIRYKINRQHPVIENLLGEETLDDPVKIDRILCLIEETVPTQGIILEEMKNPDSVPEPFNDMEATHIRLLLETAISVLKLDELPFEEKRAKLLSMEPFSEYEQMVTDILSKVV